MAIHDSWAKYYDRVYKLTYGSLYEEFTSKTLKKITGMAKSSCKMVLDIGAGTGRLAIPLAEKEYKVTAVEISGGMCDVMSKKTDEAGVEIQILNRDMTADLRPDVKDETYNIVVCVFTVLNYLTTDNQMEGFVRSASRALCHGGKALISFVEDMEPMQRFFNDNLIERSEGDDWIKRQISIKTKTLKPPLFTYDELTDGVINGEKIIPPYHDRFPLREWNKEDIIGGFNKFEMELREDFSQEFGRTGETYLLFEKL